ncbi:MAG: ATP-binding protein, partial [Rhodobacteraceae bacterium]|nr:ATP-binding protein [Paracoccaceae bacterium]
NGALFLDEFPEFSRTVLETLRQPLETGDVVVARANAHVRYPCRFMLIAAANPCKCGYLSDPERACGRAPLCGEDYLGRISGPMMDRFDIRIDVPPVTIRDLSDSPRGEDSSVVAERVAAARDKQTQRYQGVEGVTTNASAEGDLLEEVGKLSVESKELLTVASEKFRLSARAYYRVQRVARTIADLDHSDTVEKPHLAEALSYRLAG